MASKNAKQSRRPGDLRAYADPPAEWRVEHATGVEHVGRSSLERRDDSGYTFRDDLGVVADFPPGQVRGVLRREPAEPEPVNLTLPRSLGILNTGQLRDLQNALNAVAPGFRVLVFPPGAKVTPE